MRRKLILLMALLFLLAFGAGIMHGKTVALNRELDWLRQELMLLEAENEYMRIRVQELRLLHEIILEQMQGWQAEEFEATAYTLECGNGDGYTATMTVPQAEHTIAVDPKVIPLGSRVYVQGLGWRVAEDVGAAIKGRIIDLYMGLAVTFNIFFSLINVVIYLCVEVVELYGYRRKVG